MVMTHHPQRDKLSTMGELATVLAHEIKNPMNSIIIHLEVLKSCLAQLQGPETTKARADKNLLVIEGEMKRLEKVITGFLDLAAPTSESEDAEFQLNSLVSELVELLSPELQSKEIQLITKLDSETPRILGSADQVKQAILNLLINASQALGPNGQIELATGFNDKMIWVEVSDNGPGIPASLKNQIFSPYFTTKEKGSGLGLAIVRRIIREHGGYVEVDSQEDKGSQFRLYLPRIQEGASS